MAATLERELVGVLWKETRPVLLVKLTAGQWVWLLLLT